VLFIFLDMPAQIVDTKRIPLDT